MHVGNQVTQPVLPQRWRKVTGTSSPIKTSITELKIDNYLFNTHTHEDGSPGLPSHLLFVRILFLVEEEGFFHWWFLVSRDGGVGQKETQDRTKNRLIQLEREDIWSWFVSHSYVLHSLWQVPVVSICCPVDVGSLRLSEHLFVSLDSCSRHPSVSN